MKNLYLTLVYFRIIIAIIFMEINHGVYSEGMGKECTPIGNAFCFSNLYNMTKFPNVLGHLNLQEAQNAFMDFQALIKTGCSKYLEQFLCFVFVPPCTILETPLSVCRGFCQLAATKECMEILKQLSIRPEVLVCDRYPESELCISQYNIISENGSRNVTTANGMSSGNEPYILANEGEVDLFLLVINGNTIQLLDVQSPHDIDTITIYRGLPGIMPTPIDWYGDSKYIYWASNTEGKIFRGELIADSLRNVRPIIDTQSATVESLAVDWYLKVLFWTETLPIARLRASSLSGRKITTVLAQDIGHPISLTIDSTEGKLFWIDRRGNIQHHKAFIDSYSIVTESRFVVFNITPETVNNGGRPKALVADVETKRLFWVDARSQSLHSASYDGSGHKQLLKNHRYLNDPDSIAIHNQHVIWIDKQTNSIVLVNKMKGDDELVIKTFDSNAPQNIRIYGYRKTNVSSYDKSAIGNKWQELSSKENMEVQVLEGDEDDDFDKDFEGDFEDNEGKENKSSDSKMVICWLIVILFIVRFVML